MKRYIRANSGPVISEGWEYDDYLDAYVQNADDYRVEAYVDNGNVSGDCVRCDVYFKDKRLDTKKYDAVEITSRLLDEIDSYFTDIIYEHAANGEANKKYAVSAYTDSGEPVATTKWFDNAGDALRQWFYYESKYPMNAMIQGQGSAEQDIRDFCLNHDEIVRALDKQYHSPYDIEYILKECTRPAKELKHLDQLHPFGLG